VSFGFRVGGKRYLPLPCVTNAEQKAWIYEAPRRTTKICPSWAAVRAAVFGSGPYARVSDGLQLTRPLGLLALGPLPSERVIWWHRVETMSGRVGAGGFNLRQQDRNH